MALSPHPACEQGWEAGEGRGSACCPLGRSRSEPVSAAISIGLTSLGDEGLAKPDAALCSKWATLHPPEVF